MGFVLTALITGCKRAKSMAAEAQGGQFLDYILLSFIFSKHRQMMHLTLFK